MADAATEAKLAQMYALYGKLLHMQLDELPEENERILAASALAHDRVRDRVEQQRGGIAHFYAQGQHPPDRLTETYLHNLGEHHRLAGAVDTAADESRLHRRTVQIRKKGHKQ